jgi:transposase InsO family protein
MAASNGARLQRKAARTAVSAASAYSFRRCYGSCYRSKAFARACRDLELKHVRTKPYTPKTNGKAERFIQTALREWAYAIAYPTSDHRAAELPVWLHRYNWHRPHSSLKSNTPISRLGKTGDNLLRLHT